MRTTHQI